MSNTTHMCLIYNSRVPEEPLAQNSNMYVCVWKRSQEPGTRNQERKRKRKKKRKEKSTIFKMQLCMWCRKKAPGIQECLVNALKITCTQFETPESPGIRIACILVFFSSISAGTARNLWGDINSIYVSAGNSQEQEPGCQQEDPPPPI